MSGRFDLDFEFVPDAGTAGQDQGLSFADALRDQLGLKLVEGTGAVPILIVDHVEDPAPN
jgi:uncharacterized protein (TIGR03435 family)